MRRILMTLPLLPLAAQAQPAVELPPVVVEAQRAAAARQGILARFGAREVTIDRQTIEALPGGADQPLNQVLLQTPGVVQDSFGDIHVRGEHRNLQYRINGVALPEGLAGFGQVFDARSLRSVSVLTGALPAQFGFRTNAVIDLETRTGALDPGGSLGIYGGSRGTWQPHLSWAGIAGGWDVFATGSFLRSNQGIENPTSSWQSINGHTQQWRGLAYAARQLDDTTRLSIIAGGNANRFRLPVTRGTEPGFTAFGLGDFDSAALRARQWERNWYGVAALQKSLGDIDVQIAPFIRYSSISYTPSVPGEVIFNGSAAGVFRADLAMGVQADAAWRVAPTHTIRFGTQVTGERAQFRSSTTVLPLDGNGDPLDSPFGIDDRYGRTGWLYGVYLQDEWRLAERLTVNFGLRWDQAVQYTAAGQVSPRLNVAWRPTDKTTIHAGYARTFTPPQFELVQAGTIARFVGTTAAPESLENGLARPQRDHRFDIGISHRVNENLTVGIDGYYKIVRDLLDFGQFGNALIFTPFNFRQGRVYGVEFSGNWRQGPWLAYGNLALSRSTGRDLRSGQFAIEPDELAYIASKYVRTDHDQLVTGSAGVAWNGWEGGRLSGSMLYGSGLRKGFAATGKVAGYATFNFGVAQEFHGPDGGQWTARVDLLNAFDTIYQLRDGTGIGVGASQYGLRRTVYAGLSRAF